MKRKLLPLPPVDRLRGLLTYEPHTGLLKWKSMRTGVNADMVAGINNGRGHIVVRVDGRLLMAHRIIWKMVTGEEPSELIDHADTDGTNNIWTNLREADNSQNMMNARLSKRNKSGAKGVWKHPNGRFTASIRAANRQYYLGMFGTKEEAEKVVAQERERLHGDFARAA